LHREGVRGGCGDTWLVLAPELRGRSPSRDRPPAAPAGGWPPVSGPTKPGGPRSRSRA
jgi:hypothetical protein